MQFIQQSQDEGQGMNLAVHWGGQAAASDDTLRGDTADMEPASQALCEELQPRLSALNLGRVGMLAM